MRALFVLCLIVELVMRAFFVSCLIVTLVMRAFFVLCLIVELVMRAFFILCLIVTLVMRAFFVLCFEFRVLPCGFSSKRRPLTDYFRITVSIIFLFLFHWFFIITLVMLCSFVLFDYYFRPARCFFCLTVI